MLENFLYPYRLVNDYLLQATDEKISIIVSDDGQPLQIVDANQHKDFIVVQISSVTAPSDEDMDTIKSIIYPLFENDNVVVPTVVFVSYENQVQGIIRSQEVKDLYMTLIADTKISGEQLGSGIRVDSPPQVIVTAWICPDHPQTKPFYAHHSGAKIPKCSDPLCTRDHREPSQKVDSAPTIVPLGQKAKASFLSQLRDYIGRKVR